MQKFIPTNYKGRLNRFFCHPFVWYRADAGYMDTSAVGFGDFVFIVIVGMFGGIGLISIHPLLGLAFLGLLAFHFTAKWVLWNGGHIHNPSDTIRTVWDNLNTLDKIGALKKSEAAAIWDKIVDGDGDTQNRLIYRINTLLNEYDLTHGTTITSQGAMKVLDDKISDRQAVRGVIEGLQ